MQPDVRSKFDRAALSRRQILERTCLGFGSMVLADLLGIPNARGAEAGPSSIVPIYNDLKSRPTHFPPQAKAVIQLVQNGGPSQMDLFDPKPELTRLAGKPLPGGVEIHQPNNVNVLLAATSYVEVPTTALVTREKKPYVAALNGDGTIRLLPIVSAGTDGKVIKISAGLDEGIRVALNLPGSVTDGGRVNAAPPPVAASPVAPPASVVKPPTQTK